MATAEARSGDERARAAESLLAFWAQAGVDAALADAPRDRTAHAPPPPPPPPATPAPSLVPAPASHTAVVASAEAFARARGAESLGALKELAAEMLGGDRLVFWRGAETADVVVIGEAPTAEDDLGGEPFLGAPGRLLDRMLATAGLTNHALITHTVFHRPAGDRPPTPEEQALAAPILERAIALTGARALLLLGAGAGKAMLKREEPITALRGRWLEWRSHDEDLELPALATFAPAFLLRQPLAKRQTWADLLLLAERVSRRHGRGG